METVAVHPDLWAKVATFDRRCQFLLTRVGTPEHWEVIIAKDQDRVVAQDMSLPRALTAAFLAAEARGWQEATS